MVEPTTATKVCVNCLDGFDEIAKVGQLYEIVRPMQCDICESETNDNEVVND